MGVNSTAEFDSSLLTKLFGFPTRHEIYPHETGMMRHPECPDHTPNILNALPSPAPIWNTGDEGRGEGRAKAEGIFCFCLMPLSHSMWNGERCQSKDTSSTNRAGDTKSIRSSHPGI